MARPRSLYLRAERKVSLSASLVAEIELQMLNPVTSQRHYGQWSKLIEALLRRWLDERRLGLPTVEITFEREERH